MVYVNPDGTVSNNQPFSFSLISRWFTGILNFFYMFVFTLFNPGQSRQDNRYSTDYRPPGSTGPSNNPRFRGLGPSSGGPDAPPCSGCGCGI